ncbi:DUF6364 family protein [Cyclobacterium sp.]|uniref:DUF6364 family protein n=1 Tax=Cyclobacterium TaxID=68288 RepID=UPI00198AB79D|nr:DUF6364 family protein [Cyclobacterium sp.]MBD3628454.1 hypothetical protein [Cyclobacterium sp.]
MKTKLTLTVNKSIIDAAKRRAKSRGISLSRMFEEIFEEEGSYEIKTEQQRAAERLLQLLENSGSIPTKDDKALIKSHVKRKFA